MEQKNSFSAFEGKRIIFIRTLGLLIALSLMTVLIFGVFMNQLVVKNQKKSIDALNLNQLQRISSDVELVFDLLAQGMTRSMWSDDFIDLMITPNQHNADLAFRVLKVLQDQVEENDLVRKSYLYLPYADEVYVYSGMYTELEYLGDRDLIYDYLEHREEGRDPDSTSEWKILLYNRRIFLASDFCLPNFVGAMFYEINRAELYNIIQAENKTFDTTIYVYDGDGNLLFDYMAGGLQAGDFANPDLFLTASNGNTEGRYYMYTSDRLGWKYLVRVNLGESAVSFASLLSLLLPGIAFYIMVSLLFSFYITKSVYSPIERLLRITARSGKGEAGNGKERSRRVTDEADFLEMAWKNTLDRNEQHRELMDQISDDILKEVLRGILIGQERGTEAISQILAGIGRPELENGYYMAFSAEILYGETDSGTLVEQELCQRSLLQIFASTIDPERMMAAFSMGADRVTALLRFSPETSAYQIREMVSQLEQEIETAVEPLPYRVKTGRGKTYGDLLSLKLSYHESVEAIRYLQYREEGRKEGDASSVSYEQRYYAERAHHGYSMAEDGRIKEAEAEFAAIIREIGARDTEQVACLRNLIDDLMEKLIACRISQEEIRQAGLPGNVEEGWNLAASPDFELQMAQLYQRALPLLWESSRKSHSRYIEEAKEYIASHYAEGTLTLNEISAAVGISPSYLSGMFAEGTGNGLNAYLNEYRILQAKRYLNETSLNISEVGYKCGFNSPQSFTRVFKKYTGMSPKQFRENKKGQQGD